MSLGIDGSIALELDCNYGVVIVQIKIIRVKVKLNQTTGTND